MFSNNRRQIGLSKVKSQLDLNKADMAKRTYSLANKSIQCRTSYPNSTIEYHSELMTEMLTVFTNRAP